MRRGFAAAFVALVAWLAVTERGATPGIAQVGRRAGR
jgi:hypothetical protein